MKYQLKVHGLTLEQIEAHEQAHKLNPTLNPTYRSLKTAEKMARLMQAFSGLTVTVVEIK